MNAVPLGGATAASVPFTQPSSAAAPIVQVTSTATKETKEQLLKKLEQQRRSDEAASRLLALPVNGWTAWRR